MTDMKFPCEMETIDTIPMPKSIESSPVRLNRKLRPRLKKQGLDLEDVEFQQPYKMAFDFIETFTFAMQKVVIKQVVAYLDEHIKATQPRLAIKNRQRVRVF
jgi:hypothetical protein